MFHKLKYVIYIICMMAGLPFQASALEVAHDMKVAIDPPKASLACTDRISVRPDGDSRVKIFLTEKASDLNILINGSKISYEVDRSLVLIPVPRKLRHTKFILEISYNAIFNDIPPALITNTDNPGYGVSGTISENGTLLLGGAGWYPHIEADHTEYIIHVSAPQGIIAVTAGRSLGFETGDKKTVSKWMVSRPVEDLSLSADKYLVREKAVGNIIAATYFLEDSRFLEAPYLEAVERYLLYYQDLFGIYPFDKFAVVENFFPTGYGFPSYTLIGGRVLRLPFIIDTSLGHEIVHCWWGNGVYADYENGNWSEGLATYTADYLTKEKESPASALDYRRQWLRNYADLVTLEKDFPLTLFESRTDAVTRAVGYDKCAMVFHMLRQQAGDKVFWKALREIYDNYLFKKASWTDFQNSFERQSGLDLDIFFNQWVGRSGAPVPAFSEIKSKPSDTGWTVSGYIVQKAPYFEFTADLLLNTASKDIVSNILVSGSKTPFTISSPAAPAKLVFDPEYHLFRKLYAAEIPAAVNSVKGAENVTVIVADGADDRIRQAGEMLVMSLGIDHYTVLEDSEISPEAINNNDLIFIGWSGRLDRLLPENDIFSARKKIVRINGSEFSGQHDIFFGVFEHPYSAGRTISLFLPFSKESMDTVARKITHYGKYSYLIFQNGSNRIKGVWPAHSSPLIVNF